MAEGGFEGLGFGVFEDVGLLVFDAYVGVGDACFSFGLVEAEGGAAVAGLDAGGCVVFVHVLRNPHAD